MTEFKLVLSRKDGKSFQRIVKDKEASALLNKKIKEKISGKEIGLEGYELEITGGSDKSGFPMRKGILQKRKKIMLKGKGVGFCGLDRNKKKQPGLRRKKTVCGEFINNEIVQVNLKILVEGKEKLGGGEEGKEKPGEEGKEKGKESERGKEGEKEKEEGKDKRKEEK